MPFLYQWPMGSQRPLFPSGNEYEGLRERARIAPAYGST